ncbi:MAG: LamG-like jellyroll fold domain-containing protein, partial [Nanoarchaeota archaeon]
MNRPKNHTFGMKEQQRLREQLAFCTFFLSMSIIFTLLITTSSQIDARVIHTINQSDFNLGTFNKTFYNTTANFTQLNISERFFIGNYTSAILNVSSNATWNNLSWVQGGPYGQQLPNNGLDELNTTSGGANMTRNVILLHFNETGAPTTFNDSSGSGNNASCTICPTFGVNGPFGGAARFNGTNQNISLPGSLILSGSSFTISFWAQINTTASLRIIFSGTSGTGTGETIALRYNDDNQLQMFYDSADILTTGGNLFSPNSMHHFVFIYNAATDTSVIYINGTVITEGSNG